jgi:tetratricopeptide (TPR) repeat protein
MNKKESLLLRLTELMFQKERSFLSLDELYLEDTTSAYVRNIQIDSPFQELLFDGVLSQYIVEDEVSIAFTVEAYFQYMLAKVLYNDICFYTPEMLLLLLNKNKLKGLPEAVSNLLFFDIEKGDYKRLTTFIDLNQENEDIIEICVRPIILSLQTSGVLKTLGAILEDVTDNDWKILNLVSTRLEYFQLHELKKEFLINVMSLIDFNSITTVKIFIILDAILVLDKELAQKYFEKVTSISQIIEENTDLYFMLGNCEYKFGNYSNAFDINLKCLHNRIKLFGNSHIKVADSHHKIGEICYRLGEYDKALHYYEKSLDIRKKEYEEDHHDIIKLYDCFGDLFQNTGDYDKALSYHKKNLELKFKKFGSNHLDVAYSLNGIGVIYYCFGDYDKALDYYQKCKSIRLKVLGADHVDMSNSYGNIGDVFLKRNQLQEALKFYKKSLKNRIENLGKKHPYTASSYIRIGEVCREQYDFENAFLYCEKGLNIRKEVFGDHHPQVAVTYSSIAKIFQAQKLYEKALIFHIKSLDIEFEKLGKKHRHVEASYYNLGICNQSLCKYNLAIDYYEKGFSIKQNGHYPFRIAQCYEALNKKENALHYYIQSGEIWKKDFGVEVQSMQESITNIIRIAKELSIETELPAWIKELN